MYRDSVRAVMVFINIGSVDAAGSVGSGALGVVGVGGGHVGVLKQFQCRLLQKWSLKNIWNA